MSLRIWLPMTKDLRNQGLSNVTVTNNGATFNSAGKLGGCYSFGTGNSYITVDSTSLKPFTEFSFACWVKIISWNTSYSTIFAVKNSTGVSWNNLIFSLLRNASTSTLCFSISNGSNYTATSCQTGTLSLNTWYHITCTYKSGQIKLYQDGNVVNTYNTSVVPNFDSIVNLWIGKSNESSYQSNNLLNDVRIYDHCLSPMEVKELSKGLVLHYPLNRNGWGQENLLSGNNAKITTWTNYMPDSVILSGDGYDNKYTLIKGIGGWEKIFTDAITVTSGKTYTLSFDYSVEQNYTGYNGQFGLSVCTTSQAKYGADTDVITKVNFGTVKKSKSRTSVTFIATSNTIYLVANGGNINDGQENISFYISYIKLEEGSIATPWCPNSSDALATAMGLNGTIEYDCSGYCNNLNKNGIYSYTSDTPKYTVSTVFNGTEWMNGTTPGAEILTLACWAKTTKNKSTSQFMVADSTSGLCISFYSGTIISYFGSGNQSTGSKCTLGSAYKENDWNHFVVVKTGTGTRTVYCNGVEQTATSNDYWGSAAGLFIGSRNNSATLPFYGELSDIRAYATALSADDVKSLYQNCATIDADGTIHGQIRS